MMLLRHLLWIALMPFVMTVVIPIWLGVPDKVNIGVGTSPLGSFAQIAGIILIVVGAFLFSASLRRFATEGEGTLAPWDPPKHLVLHGPYRYVRNPMISGVIFVLFGEALVLLSKAQLEFALIFFVANLIQTPLIEEPQLKRRFGNDYVEYCRHVPRFIPRLRPWQPAD